MSNTHEPMTSRAALVRDLAEVLNRHSAENRSKTPDFVLAEYLVRSLEALDHTFNERARWYADQEVPETMVAGDTLTINTTTYADGTVASGPGQLPQDSPAGLPTMADDAAALRTAADVLKEAECTETEHTIRAIARRLSTNSYGALERKQATPAFSIRLTSDKSVELSGFSERMAIKHDSGQVGGWRLVGLGDTFTFARKYSIDDLCDVLVGRMIAEGMDRVTRIVPAGDTSFMICVAKNAPPNKIDA